ncbi:MAG: hypothetical protein HOW73_30515 [Polyangiaceae bacterium]|nr:hypothetical protein [Polyangiaceae bacterium]
MRLATALVISMVLSPATAAWAGDGDGDDSAQKLFDEGLAAFDAGRIDEACNKFEESMRREAANGTLLNLARCHELEGNTATAWAEYTDVATSASRVGDTERATEAAEAATRLAPSLAKLRIAVERPAPLLVVTRDGVIQYEGSWNRPMPVDPGTHQVVAEAPGRKPFIAEIRIKPGESDARIVIPELAAAGQGPDHVDASVTSPRSAEHHSEKAHKKAPTGLTFAGIVFGSLGVTATAVGGVLGAISLSDLSEARENPELCPGDICTPSGRVWVDSAEEKGNASTALFLVGGSLIATGITLVVLDFKLERKDTDTALRVAPVAGPAQAGVQMAIDF